jgi:hydroxyacylglutathione hydrolase
MFFKQIKYHGDNFSYIIADQTTGEAAVVDPSSNSVAIISLLRDQNLKAKYIIDTHYHIDHTAGNQDVKSAFDAKIVAHKVSRIVKDIEIVDGDIIKIGQIRVSVIHTPGHSPDSICLLFDHKILTGDTLFVGECGRVDLIDGSPQDMYRSLFDKLSKLDDDTEVYPGHDYGPKPHSTIGLEKKTNYVLEKRTFAEFIKFIKHA